MAQKSGRQCYSRSQASRTFRRADVSYQCITLQQFSTESYAENIRALVISVSGARSLSVIEIHFPIGANHAFIKVSPHKRVRKVHGDEENSGIRCRSDSSGGVARLRHVPAILEPSSRSNNYGRCRDEIRAKRGARSAEPTQRTDNQSGRVLERLRIHRPAALGRRIGGYSSAGR
jgi:hypothetical protein